MQLRYGSVLKDFLTECPDLNLRVQYVLDNVLDPQLLRGFAMYVLQLAR